MFCTLDIIFYFVQYFVLKSFDNHTHENESFYAQKITLYFDVEIEVEIHILEPQQNLVKFRSTEATCTNILAK